MEEGDANVASSSVGPGNRSFVAHSPCSSVSLGSPSSRSEQAAVTPISGKKSKRVARAANGDKSERGLRQFSMKVCQKVESKGRTTYNEVADELVAEFANSNHNVTSSDLQQYEEKNIRRRVYDALNVLMAMDIISKDKKEIQWKGLPRTSLGDIEQLKVERIALKNRVEKKSAYLRELQEQHIGLQNLVKRNEKFHNAGHVPSGGVALPFILIQTRPHATVEVEISEDMQLVHFDFNSTPFELHDDAYVLRAMRLCDGHPRGDVADSSEGFDAPGTLDHSQKYCTVPGTSSKPPSPPPVPGILKGRTKHDTSNAN